MKIRTMALLGVWSWTLIGGCVRFDDFSLEPDGQTQVSADGGSVPTSPVPSRAALVLKPPGAAGPFIEPALDERPNWLYAVVVGRGASPQELHALAQRLRGVKALPLGYPAVDQAAVVGSSAEKAPADFVLLGGKFARKAWAEALVKVLHQAGFKDARVAVVNYRFDRNRPARNDLAGPKGGQVFAGMAGAQVPLLTEPGKEATGSSGMLSDGQLVTVLEERWVGNRRWYRLRGLGQDGAAREGFLPARRVLTDANVFPASTGRRGVLGVSLGYHQGRCRWDYWLVDRGYAYRRLLKAGGERMPHAFSPDGSHLAYTTFDPAIEVLAVEEKGAQPFSLGPGISPSFNTHGTFLYFRGTGIKGKRDQVYRLASSALRLPDKAALKPKMIYDLGGTPHYPKAISAIPAQVDFLDSDDELFTLFFRLVDKKGKKQVQRWGVRFTPQGKVLEKAGALIGE